MGKYKRQACTANAKAQHARMSLFPQDKVHDSPRQASKHARPAAKAKKSKLSHQSKRNRRSKQRKQNRLSKRKQANQAKAGKASRIIKHLYGNELGKVCEACQVSKATPETCASMVLYFTTLDTTIKLRGTYKYKHTNKNHYKLT